MAEENIYELLYMAHLNDEWAISALIKRFEPYILKRYAEIHESWKGFEYDDAYQAACYGILNAIAYYRGDKEMSFNSFVILCIERQLLTVLRRIKKISSIDYFSNISLDMKIKDNDDLYIADKLLIDEDSDPANYVNFKVLAEKVYFIIGDNEMDKQIFLYRLKGYSYKEIAKIMKITCKTVDNSIQRIRKKISILFD